MTSLLHHTPHLPFLRLTSRNHHLYFFDSLRSLHTRETRDNNNPARKDLARTDPPLQGVILFSMIPWEGHEAVVRTQFSAQQIPKHPVSLPDYTTVHETPGGGLETSTGRPPPRTWGKPPPKRAHYRALHARAMRPTAMYPVSPPPLLLQIRASRKHGYQTGQSTRTIDKTNPSSLRLYSLLTGSVGPSPFREVPWFHYCIFCQCPCQLFFSILTQYRGYYSTYLNFSQYQTTLRCRK